MPSDFPQRKSHRESYFLPYRLDDLQPVKKKMILNLPYNCSIGEESHDNFDADREIFGINSSSSDPEDNNSETENAAAALLSLNNAGSK